MLRHCAEIGSEDGIDPRETAKARMFESLRGRKANYKALQVCRQVERALALEMHSVTPPECAELMIQSVLPLEDSRGQSRSNLLIVTLQVSSLKTQEELRNLEYQLLQSKGALRAIVASAIHRRKTPELTFRLVQR